MQDKFSIGPVTIVQLVGIAAKPRIASAQADGAARAADPIPPSAAAGLGDDLTQPISEIASSYLNLKASAALGVSADPVRGQLSMESGVDRPVVDASAPVSANDPSTFEESPSDDFLPNPGLGGRDAAPPTNDDAGAIIPDGNVSDPAVPADETVDLGYVFDGVDSFGDDEILDFTIVITDTPLLSDTSSAPIASGEYDHMLVVSLFDELGSAPQANFPAEILSDLPLTKDDLIAFDPHPSAIDAVPVT